ncbi:MAG: ABC transporter permease [Roseburia sp.]|nr:ABC transporter permease [Roseburia sp.]MCM1277848.1 ABC transporter permease [Robinsoniella sp.]
MWSIVKRECRNYLKNPLFYIGAFLVFIGVYMQLKPYLQLHYFVDEKELEQAGEQYEKWEVVSGYIPASREERYGVALEQIEQDLQEPFFGMSKKEAEMVVASMEHMSEKEAIAYLEQRCSYIISEAYFSYFDMKKGTLEEVNHYIEEKMEEAPYTHYFAGKYADFFGVYMVFYAMILLAFLFWEDMKKDTYELLHTKPISPVSYVLGKLCGGMTAMLAVTVVITVIFWQLSLEWGKTEGFPVNALDIWKAVCIYNLPNLLVIVCIYGGVSLLFKSPLPAVPALILYAVYSNMGSRNAEGVYGYYGRPLAIMVRFPGSFLEIAPPPMAAANQTALLLFSVLLTGICILLWKRRKVL